MKAVLHRHKNWWEFWKSSKPKELTHGKDYVLNGTVFTLKREIRLKDSVIIEYEANLQERKVR